MKRILFSLLCMILVLSVATSSFAASKKVKGKEKVEFDEFAGPIIIEPSIEDFSIKGKKGNVKVKVKISLDKEAEKDVKVDYKLYKLTEEGNTDLLEEEGLLKGSIGKNGKSENISLKSLEEGQYEIVFVAQSKGIEDVFKIFCFTVTEDKIIDEWLEFPSVESKAIFKEDEKNDISDDSSKTLANSSFSGTWIYYDRSNNPMPFRNARVKLYYSSQPNAGWNSLGNTTTDLQGNWSYSFDPSGKRYLRVTVETYNSSIGQVNDASGRIYTWEISGIDLSKYPSGGSIGTGYTNPASETDKKVYAVWAFDDMYRTYSKLSETKNPGTAKIYWYVGSTTGNHYNGAVYLTETGAKRPETVVHELGHQYMDNLIGLSKSGCGTHYVNKASTQNCAWEEGWADFLPLVINGTTIFYGYDMENTGSDWDKGDAVEGQVAASLWDMVDTANDGLDTKSTDFSNVYRVMYSNGSLRTFSDFWKAWLSNGKDPSFIDCLRQNTIYY